MLVENKENLLESYVNNGGSSQRGNYLLLITDYWLLFAAASIKSFGESGAHILCAL